MSAMTDQQRAALAKLTAKRRAFVLAYVGRSAGNATDAAREAGYGKPRREGSRLLTFADVVSAIEAFRAPVEDAAVADLQEVRAFWTRVMRGEEKDTVVTAEGFEVEAKPTVSVRLKAASDLARSQGGFLDRQEVTREDKGVRFVAVGTVDELRDVARGGKG